MTTDTIQMTDVGEHPRSMRKRRALLLGAFIIAAWALIAWNVVRHEGLVTDWNGWRQSDTQTIAVNLLQPGASLFRPQINWRGDGPGYVETELQIYTAAVAGLSRVVGVKEWLGQLVSLLAIIAAAIVVWFHLARRNGDWPAVAGVLAFLGARTSSHLATVVMPDATALLAFTVAWTCITSFVDQRRTRDLVGFAAAGALAMLIKPSMAHLGIASFVLIALRAPSLMRERRIWIAWIAMLAVFAAYLTDAHALYTNYGNTFGLLFGPERKNPGLQQLLMASTWLGAVKNAVRWGMGQIGAAALIILIARRRVQASQWALLTANIILMATALNYMSQDGGNYYFATMSVLAAESVALLSADLRTSLAAKWRLAAAAAVAVVLAVQAGRNLQVRHLYAHFDDPLVKAVAETGDGLRGLVSSNERVIVRSTATRFDPLWHTPSNFHDPRIFYLARATGWAIPRDVTANDLEALVDSGARFLADPNPDQSHDLDLWLLRHGELAWTGHGGGRIWRLQ